MPRGCWCCRPSFFKGASDDGLFAYYSEIIERVGDDRLAVYLYHIPQMSYAPITLGLIERLLKHYPGAIAGAKDSRMSNDFLNAACVDRQSSPCNDAHQLLPGDVVNWRTRAADGVRSDDAAPHIGVLA